MIGKHTSFCFYDWHDSDPQPSQEYIQNQTTSPSDQLEIAYGDIDRAKEAAADEDNEADMPSAGLVKEEVITDIKGARPGPHMGFDRPPVLCESCKPLRTAVSKRACRTACKEEGAAGVDSYTWQRADGTRPGYCVCSRSVIANTKHPLDAEYKSHAAVTAPRSGCTNGGDRPEASETDNRQQELRPVKATTPGSLALPTPGRAVHSRSADHNHDFVESLKYAWPDYWNAHHLNKQDKLEEIRKRPSRKQMFGRSASHSRLCPETPLPPLLITSGRPLPQCGANLGLAARDDSRSLEDLDVDAKPKKCKTLEEFFDLPAVIMPIMSNGALAYRDGTVSRSGRLPRAREVFKP